MQVDIEFRARLTRREGRKLWIEAEASHDGQVVSTATGLFIAIDREKFAPASA